MRTMIENKINDIFVNENDMPEVATKAKEVFADDCDAPFVEIDGVMVPNRVFFDD